MEHAGAEITADVGLLSQPKPCTNKKLSSVPTKVSMDAASGTGSAAATTTVGSRLSALFAKMDGLAAPGTYKTLRQIGDLCIRVAMYSNLVPAQPAGSRKMTSLLNLTTAQFVECVLWESDRCMIARMRHRVTGKTFVVKEPAAEEEDEEKQALLNLAVLREACFMAACRGHPSLVRFHAVARDPTTNHSCIVMEHVGPSLLEVLRGQRNDTPFPERDVRSVARQVLGGAQALHERGVVHGAINTENVLVADYGDLVVKIGGAGQATSAAGNVMCYRAPEVLASEGSSGGGLVSDSWSIGCWWRSFSWPSRCSMTCWTKDSRSKRYFVCSAYRTRTRRTSSSGRRTGCASWSHLSSSPTTDSRSSKDSSPAIPTRGSRPPPRCNSHGSTSVLPITASRSIENPVLLQ